MQTLSKYKDFISLLEQEEINKKGISAGEVMKAFKDDAAVRSNVLGTINSNPNYSSVFNAIKNYWTKQIPIVKNKPKDQLTAEESNMLETIESNFKEGNTQDIEYYAAHKVLSGHSDEFSYDKNAKKLSVTGTYKETPYDKEIKSK
jgi:hypothetical protein